MRSLAEKQLAIEYIFSDNGRRWWGLFNLANIAGPAVCGALMISLGAAVSPIKIVGILFILAAVTNLFHRRVFKSIKVFDDELVISGIMGGRAFKIDTITDIKCFETDIKLWKWITLRKAFLIEMYLPDRRIVTVDKNFTDNSDEFFKLLKILREKFECMSLRPRLNAILQDSHFYISFGNGLELNRHGFTYNNKDGFLPYKFSVCEYDNRGWINLLYVNGENERRIWMKINPSEYINTHMLVYLMNIEKN